MSNYTQKAVRGTGIIMGMGILAAVAAYITRIVLARNLGPEEFGLFSSVLTFVVFFLFFRDLGIGTALIKFIPEFEAQKKYDEMKTYIGTALSIQLISSIIFVIVVFMLSDILARHYFKVPIASTMLNILTLYIVGSVFFTTLRETFHGLRSMFLFASSEFIKNVAILLLMLFFFGRGFEVLSPIWAYALVSPLVVLIYVPFLLKRFNPFKYTFLNMRAPAKHLILFGVPVFATNIGSRIIGYTDTLMLTFFKSLEEVGIYNVVLPTALTIIYLGSAVSAMVFPLSSELWIKDDKRRLAEGMRMLHKYMFIVAIPVTLTIISFSGFLIELLFGREYVTGSTAFKILLIGALFYIVTNVNSSMLSGIGKPQEVTKIIMGAAALNLGCNMILIPLIGINGAALATSASYFLTLIMSTRCVAKYIELKSPWKDWLKLIAPMAVFFGAMEFVKWLIHVNPMLEIVITLIPAAVLYAITLYLLNLVNIEELKHYAKLTIK